jgi:hypothetical protein
VRGGIVADIQHFGRQGIAQRLREVGRGDRHAGQPRGCADDASSRR